MGNFSEQNWGNSPERHHAHVLAAAVVSECQLIVTFNLRDFPPESVTPHDLEVVTPDDFLLDQFDLYPSRVLEALRAQSRESARPTLSLSKLIDSLERCGLPKFAAELRRRRAGDVKERYT